MSGVSELNSPLLGVAVAIGLGLLVGMQREYAEKQIGLRSFALISVIGAIVGVLATSQGPWLIAAGLVAITIAILAHAYLTSGTGAMHGMTTELAAIAMFLVGALTTSGYLTAAVVIGGVITLLLHWKTPMHAWVERISTVERGAIGRFVLITLVIWPVLPDATFGPFQVLNPRQVWLMVVLIVSLNLAGYLLLKVINGRGGAILGGALGGLVSSTAVTVSFASKARADESVVPIAGLVVLVASLIVYLRIIIEIAVVAPELLKYLIAPVLVFIGICTLAVGFHFSRLSETPEDIAEPNNPAELKTALLFTLVYALVLLVSAGVNQHFGEAMLYPVAIVSGLTDVDAITLSIGRLFAESSIDGNTAWRVIFVASIANLGFKAGVVAVLGGARLRRQLFPTMLVLLALGIVGVIAWPQS